MWKASILILILCQFGLSSCKINNRPVIGILDIRAVYALTQYDFPSEGAFLHAQYVKFLESVGAIVIPIHYNNTQEQTEYLMEHINGVLFTGGALDFVDEKTGKPIPYTQTAIHIFNKAKELNDNGINFPIWGTCMGHQLLTYLIYGSESILNKTAAMHTSDPLNFTFTDPKQTKLFTDFPIDLLQKAKIEPLTANFHTVGVLTERFLDPKSNLTQFYNLLATSLDENGVSYVANMEAINYPFFTSQYHPEVTEFTFSYNFTNHSDSAREFAHLLAEKFVSEARKNSQQFNTYHELVSHLIQNECTDLISPDATYDNYYCLGRTHLISE